MNLKSIKLVGFKSFVDATLIPLQSNLIGIVGPNGCGKSNIVDAIRWVIGESSAKQLRSQSMAEVIFNGAGNRKPVGMAAVELIFENNDARLGGEYAKFDEISVRREVNLSGQSQYFLNGINCRRRDIIDIFLGTGLSYSIIEQGMIAKLIEAKPDELRANLEEASGVAQYKERRRETEIRMRHTQENLVRLQDLNEELSKQLRHLQRQAEAAQRYTDLKQQQRQFQLELKTMQWRVLSEQVAKIASQAGQYQLLQDEHLAKLYNLETNIEKIRGAHTESNEQRNQIQKQYYHLGTEIARLEQRIQNCQDQMQHWQKECMDIENQQRQLIDHTEEQWLQIIELNQKIEQLQPEATAAKGAAQAANQALQTAEMKMTEWQQRWDSFQTQAAQFANQTSVLKTNLQHYEQQFENLVSRHTQLQERQTQLPLMALTAEITLLTEETARQRQDLETLQQSLSSTGTAIQQQRQQNSNYQQQIHEQRQQWQALQNRYVSLEALQQSALGYHDDHTKTWLTQHSIHDRPRLGQTLRVNAGWELAVETVLSGCLDTICLDNIEDFAESLAQMTQGQLTLIDTRTVASINTKRPWTLLANQIQSQWPIEKWLTGIYIAEDLTSALVLRMELAGDESIITREGIWVGKNWIRINKPVDSNTGVLLRELELKQLAREIEQSHTELQQQYQHLQQGEAQLHRLEEQRDTLHREYQTISAHLTDIQTQLSAKQSRFTELQQQQQRLIREIQENEQGIQNLQNLLAETREYLTQANEDEQTQSCRQTQLLIERDQYRENLTEIRQYAEQQRQTADELTVQCTAITNQLALCQQSSLHEQQQRQRLEQRHALLTAQLAENQQPLVEMKSELQQQLNSRLMIENELKNVESQLADYRQQDIALTQEQQETQERLEMAKKQHQELQMEQQAIKVRQTTIEEQLAEQNLVVEHLLTNLPQTIDVDHWEQQLAKVTDQISRLGMVNLAAIDEFQVVNERKTYLDKQQADLNEALEILRNAIIKIDRETRTKFQETFARVNQNFQALFPQIFGGGKAVLELTEQDWLTAGVVVKAQPPGKRNNTIHSLSGGEKALTAIALVFSIFQLNPAPFCVLDEVDAPLDDMNVSRFCQLVKEMAKTTQFIIISHNKLTISLADRLLGVTMQEAGVSRIVSVNVAEAVALAEL